MDQHATTGKSDKQAEAQEELLSCFVQRGGRVEWARALAAAVQSVLCARAGPRAAGPVEAVSSAFYAAAWGLYGLAALPGLEALWSATWVCVVVG